MEVLKIDYFDTLRFKRLVGYSTKVDFDIIISESEALAFLKRVRECLRQKTDSFLCEKLGNVEVSLRYEANSLRISVMELDGQMSRPLGEFIYDSYLGGKTLLEGVRSAIEELTE